MWVEICYTFHNHTRQQCHAPRERVSWNHVYLSNAGQPRVTLHVSVWVEIAPNGFAAVRRWSRSTWACELKSRLSFKCGSTSRHAPRERVSWNNRNRIFRGGKSVTLHVSVWVEMQNGLQASRIKKSRSTWACELKLFLSMRFSWYSRCHAPRERVSWNFRRYNIWQDTSSHAPRERVSWNILEEKEKNSSAGSRSTWACELKWHWYMVIIVAVCHAPRERVSWNHSPPFPDYFRHLVTLHVSVWVEMDLRYIPCRRHGSRSTWACELK